MKRALLCAGLMLCAGPFVVAQQNAGTATSTRNNQAVVSQQSSATVRQAQQHLKKAGYYNGAVDGVLGPRTQAAIQKFQSDKGLPQTGRLDTATQNQLAQENTSGSSSTNAQNSNGAPPPVTTAATDLGSDTKEAGHEVVNGHPVDAAKTFGTGAKDMGESIGHKTKKVYDKTHKKVEHGMDVLSKKIYGTDGSKSAQTPNQNSNQGQAVGQQSNNPPKTNNPQ